VVGRSTRTNPKYFNRKNRQGMSLPRKELPESNNVSATNSPDDRGLSREESNKFQGAKSELSDLCRFLGLQKLGERKCKKITKFPANGQNAANTRSRAKKRCKHRMPSLRSQPGKHFLKRKTRTEKRNLIRIPTTGRTKSTQGDS